MLQRTVSAVSYSILLFIMNLSNDATKNCIRSELQYTVIHQVNGVIMIMRISFSERGGGDFFRYSVKSWASLRRNKVDIHTWVKLLRTLS